MHNTECEMDVQAQRIDREYLVDQLTHLLRVPTHVPLGTATLMEPDDPKLVRYVQQELRPELVRIGALDLIDAGRNNLVARVGRGRSGRSLLLMVYTVTQHHNLMEDPFSGKVANGRQWGYDEPCAFGQGASQNKVHHAVALSLLKYLRDASQDLEGTLYVAINNEGRSSHACSRAILDALPEKPDAAVLLTKTGFGIQLGNRGRVDAVVTVKGKATHSSQPGNGLSAINGANDAINRIRAMRFEVQHPILGGQHAVVYQVTYSPMAPHTLPDTARLLVDRRLLPGDDPAEAVAGVRAAIGDLSPYGVTVEQGVHMVPALVAPDERIVQDLSAAYQTVLGSEPRTFYGGGTFDAGGPVSAGVPAVMFGASAGDWPLGIDFIPLSHAYAEAEVVTQLVLDTLG
ncbi:MAG: M20/M25/M40 family metallo-hydrolase [Chloroflexi bacterium]|nr:M20/M25/M40 family metallo-hydrolase [Chloroflexota bacterium]